MFANRQCVITEQKEFLEKKKYPPSVKHMKTMTPYKLPTTVQQSFASRYTTSASFSGSNTFRHKSFPHLRPPFMVQTRVPFQ